MIRHVCSLGVAAILLAAPAPVLADTHRFTSTHFYNTMGQTLEFEIANVVDPNFTVVTRVRKAPLPRR